MAIPAINVLGNPNVTEGNFQIAIEGLRKSVIGSGKAYDSANTYSELDTCVSGGIVYYSKINSNTGNTPAVNANWGLFSELIKLIESPITNAIPKIKANGTVQNSNVIIDDNGNVGISTPTPTAKLHVQGNIRTACSSGDAVNTRGINFDIDGVIHGRLAVDNSDNLLYIGGGIGYGTGSGGTVTQLTNKSTSVALNKPSGDIIMHNSALAAGYSASFGLFNSLISQTDTVSVSLVNGAANGDAYRTEVRQITTNQIVIRITNISGDSLSEALTIHFNIHKGANS